MTNQIKDRYVDFVTTQLPSGDWFVSAYNEETEEVFDMTVTFWEIIALIASANFDGDRYKATHYLCQISWEEEIEWVERFYVEQMTGKIS
jgi:hypothetical protein